MKRNQPHILVVDDNVDVADSMAELLCLWGYDGNAQYDGTAGLLSAGLRRPAAVLLDLDMPRMDGYEFARRLREFRKGEQVPIVAITGYTSEACRVHARKCGIGDYLFKPADPVALRKLLAAITFQPHVREDWQLPRPDRRRRAGEDEEAIVDWMPITEELKVDRPPVVEV